VQSSLRPWQARLFALCRWHPYLLERYPDHKWQEDETAAAATPATADGGTSNLAVAGNVASRISSSTASVVQDQPSTATSKSGRQIKPAYFRLWHTKTPKKRRKVFTARLLTQIWKSSNTCLDNNSIHEEADCIYKTAHILTVIFEGYEAIDKMPPCVFCEEPTCGGGAMLDTIINHLKW